MIDQASQTPLVATYDDLIEQLTALDADLTATVEQAGPILDRVHPRFRRSAANMLQYLALRERDIRQLQIALADLGLSSLGRAEAHVQDSVRAVIGVLYALAGRDWTPPASSIVAGEPVSLLEGQALLEQHTDALLGPGAATREARIMVTSATDLAGDVDQLAAMLDAGMNVLRINCAHDSAPVWAQMIDSLREAEARTGRSCRIIMDLAGPKLRTGPVVGKVPVIKWRPQRDAFGHIVSPARIWLAPEGVPAPEAAAASLPMPANWLETLNYGDHIRFTDTRKATRHLTVSARDGEGWWATSLQTSYVAPGTELEVRERHGRTAEVGEFPQAAGFLTLHAGDRLVVSRSLDPGTPAQEAEDGSLIPARIGCTLPEVFAAVKPGERILFDDGKIEGVIREVAADAMTVEIVRARDGGARLRGEKGINLPDTDLALSALTAKDLTDLPFVVEHADMIDFSFVSHASDVESLQAHLTELGGKRPGIVLKIETRRAFERLPEIVLAAMREETAGIMIARGDLAVEVGWERLAEIQEEILWLAEAAHLPVIWATQVLESLAQTGLPSRSEITDAAMGERAECVMLNKGPHIVEAIAVLDSILTRMESHQSKKRALLRRLRSWSAEAAQAGIPEGAPSA
ncbi:MAG: pyruvate kinase [Thermomicrobiales bacterium]